MVPGEAVLVARGYLLSNIAPARVQGTACRSRIAYFDNLRAIAIMMVLATHCFPPANLMSGTLFNEHHPLVSLIGGATAIFVFIAGFFYERVYRQRLSTGQLLQQRAAALLPPYLFISLVLIASGLEPGIRTVTPTAGQSPLAAINLWLITGTAGPAMWFVPFILALLLFTPAFARFATLPRRAQLAVLGVLLAVSMTVPRHPYILLQNVPHFALFYAFGIFWARHEAALGATVRRGWVLAGLGLLLALGMAAQYRIGVPTEFGAPEPMFGARDLIVVRKMILIALLIGLLSRFLDRPVTPLTPLAERSFGLFFVHQPVLLWLKRAFGLVAVYHDPWPLSLMLWVATLTVSLAVLALGRALLGPRGRLLLGA